MSGSGRGVSAAGIQKVPHPRITVQSGLTALFTHLSTISVDGAAAPPPSPLAHFDVCIFPLWGRTRVASRYRAPPPPSPCPLGTAARRSAIVGVGKGFVEGALGAGVCAVRNFYADDGVVCRGSISEQHPLDFQGFRIDSNSAPRRNFTPFLVRDILVPACPTRNIASAAPTFFSFSYSLPRHCPSIGVNHRCVDGNQW